MPCFSRINADVKEGFCCLEEVNCVLCSLDRAAEDVCVIDKLGWWLGEKNTRGVAGEVGINNG